MKTGGAMESHQFFFLQHRLATQAASDYSEVEILLIIVYDFHK